MSLIIIVLMFKILTRVHPRCKPFYLLTIIIYDSIFLFRKTSNRIARIIAPTQYVQHQTFSPPSQQQHQQKYGPSPNNFIPAANYYFSNRVDNVETIEYDPNPKPNPTTPTTKAPAKQVQPNLYQNFSPVRQNSHHQNMMPSQREISETDLFLLSAIEKLTYRVDYLEKRLKRTEQLVLYLMEGTPEQEEQYQRPGIL